MSVLAAVSRPAVRLALREIDRAEFRMAHIALVSGFQRSERLARWERGWRAIGGGRLPRHSAEPERDNTCRAELQQIPPIDPFVLAIDAHDPVSLVRGSSRSPVSIQLDSVLGKFPSHSKMPFAAVHESAFGT
jgi:hypothetical protein